MNSKLHFFSATCQQCGDTWYAPCWIEFGMVAPEYESCQDCGGDIEIDTEDEWFPSMDREREREVPFDL